jgi:hypothetical protein
MTHTPRREAILKAIQSKAMTAAQIGEAVGLTRDGAYKILNAMAEQKIVKRLHRSNQAFWKPYRPPVVAVRPERFDTGTTKDPLSLAYMQTPTRPGSMDAYALPSKGLGA